MRKSRFDFIEFDALARHQLMSFKETFLQLDHAINALSPGRAKELALAKIEETYMWIGKAIRDEQIQREADEQDERRNHLAQRV